MKTTTATLTYCRKGNVQNVTVTINGETACTITERTISEKNASAHRIAKGESQWLRDLPLEITGDAAIAEAVITAVAGKDADEFSAFRLLRESSQGFVYASNWAKRDPRTKELEAANKARQTMTVEI